MRHLRRAAVVALVVGTLITSAGTALAAPPGNDTYSGRTVVGATPFTDSLDTTEATTDSDDTDIGPLCGAPTPEPTDASVWYEITPAADSTLRLEMALSTYAVGAIVATGSPGNWSLVGCTFGLMTWPATAGTTYTVLVRDAQVDGGGNGGTLNLTIDVPPPPPTADITVNPVATFNPRTGTATVSGTWSCPGGAPGSIVRLAITLTQQAGPLIVSGRDLTREPCDSTPLPWSAEIPSSIDGSRFHGGKAATSMNAITCGPTGCGLSSADGTVWLRGGPPA